MASTSADICNRALSKLGAARITLLTDNTVEAKLCNLIYDDTRREVLRAHPWRFAIARATLDTPNNPGPTFDWGFSFPVPNDCLRMINVGLPGDRWSREGQNLMYDYSAADIVYIQDVTDVTKFDENFVEALSCKLAVDMGYQLVQSVTLQDQMKKLYDAQLALARSYSAQEQSSPRVYADMWIRQRY